MYFHLCIVEVKVSRNYSDSLPKTEQKAKTKDLMKMKMKETKKQSDY